MSETMYNVGDEVWYISTPEERYPATIAEEPASYDSNLYKIRFLNGSYLRVLVTDLIPRSKEGLEQPQPKFKFLEEVMCIGEGKGKILAIKPDTNYMFTYLVHFDDGQEMWCAERCLEPASAKTDIVNSTVKEIPADLYDRLLKLGIIDESGVRDHNVGASDYSDRTIQAWSIWIDWKLDPWEADIVKRIGRTKVEPGMTPIQQRILDFKKIVHISQEKIRQLEFSEQNNTKE